MRVFWNEGLFRQKNFAFISSIVCLGSLFGCALGKCSYSEATSLTDCRNRNLTSVPVDIALHSKVIDLSLNRISHLDKNSFNCCSIVTEIYLAGNNLTGISYDTFSHLNYLHILDLSNNHLAAFQVDTPISLEVLYLDHNPLTSDYIFQQRIQFLKYLSLVGANLTKPPVGLFSPFLPALQYLDLQDNPSLTITVDDLRKLKHLRILYLSPRIFAARNKIQKCKDFVRTARDLNIEVKAFACYPEESFAIKGRYFERTYQIEEAMYDQPENVLKFPYTPISESKNYSCIHDLQKLVSNGMTNFIRSLLMEKLELDHVIHFKIKYPLRLEDYAVPMPRARLYDVHMSGFPSINMGKEPVLSTSSVDAEYIKRFQNEFDTTDINRDIVISGHFEVDKKFGDFSCKFTNASYHTKRAMLRRYDFRILPQNVHERIGFEKMDCSTSLSNQYSSNVIEMALSALSKNWLDSVCNLGSVVTVQPALLNATLHFSKLYRDRVLEEVIRESIHYLEKINIHSFDVTPVLNLKESGLETSIPEMTYNIQINDLFNYKDHAITYRTVHGNSSMKIFVETVINYRNDNSAKLAITAKSDPADVMQLFIKKIEFNLHLEVNRLNKVNKLEIADITVNVIEKETQQRPSFILSFVKKYLDMELAKEFKRSLKFLTGKIDFFSLNVS